MFSPIFRDTQTNEDNNAVFEDEAEVVSSDDDAQAVEKSKPRKEGGKAKIKRKSKKDLEKEKELQRKIEEEAALRAKAMTPEEIMSEKLKQQKLVEAADNKLTEELFGAEKAKLDDGVYDATTCATILSALKFNSSQDFQVLAQALSKKLQIEQKPVETTEFLKELIRGTSVMLPYEDLVDIDGVINVIKNTKVKTKLNKKKKKKGKTFTNVRRDDFDSVGNNAGNYGVDYDEDDFM